MRDLARTLAAALLGMICLGEPFLAAAEASRVDGRRVRGTLTLEKGRLHFTPTAGEAVSLADITRIRFAEITRSPFRIGGGRRVCLRDGQQITGRILGLDKDTLTLHTAWAARVELPRGAVASVDSLPGWRTVVEDDFHAGLKAFTTSGEPALVGAGMEPRSVVLRSAGQGLSYMPRTPPEAGRVGVNFQEQDQTGGARWTLELLFQEGERSRRATVTVAGAGEHYEVDAGGLKGVARSVAKTAGWHRLIVQFTKRSLRITCDDDVLWHNLEQGLGGTLKQVTMSCRKPPGGAAVRGAVAWTEFCLERAVNEYPKPPTDTGQDEVRLASDDQLFGRILQADRRVIQIEGRFGKRSLPWSEIAGCAFRRPPAPPRPNEKANVRILVNCGLCPEADVLEGVVKALDERRLTLRHALLGEVIIERGWLRELQPLPRDLK